MTRRRAAQALGVAVVLLALAYVARPVGHVPPYDANLVRLAESERQGYCAGETFWNTQGMGDASRAATCRDTRRGLSDEPNLSVVQRAFCRAIVDQGWEGDVPACLGILDGYQYWPTYDGSITDQWNRARPYPKPALSGGGDAGDRGDGSRTGGRDAPSRPGINR